MAPKKAAKKEEAKKEEPAAKRKVEEAAKEEEPPAKEAKTEEKKEPEEQEKDAPKETRPTIKAGSIGFDPNSTSLNVIPTMNGTLLTSLNEGGLQYLIAGARANVGVKAGRYMFEAKIFEVLNPADLGQSRTRPPMPKQLLRIGFSTSGSSLTLGESEEHVYFDSEGAFTAEKKKKSLGKRFTRDQVIAVVLNLDAKSPNKNTISLFRDGERLCEPQALPEALHGKTLFPHVSFRNVSIHVPFGSAPMKALPFSCRTVQEAATKDAQVVEAKKQDKYNVVFPVGFPDEGTFDWLDGFLEKNPDYVELSDRSIMEWARASGLWLQKGAHWQNSNDKPNMNFGLPGMEDNSVRRVINTVASIVPRNYVVMEVKSNLVAAERAETLQRFSAPHFKKIARVAMGEPKADFKQGQLDSLLKEKQEKATEAWKRKKAEVERKKQIEAVKKKQQEAMKKRMEEAAEKKAAAAKAAAEKKAAEAADKKEGEAKAEGEGDKMAVDEEGKKEEEKKEEETKEEAKKEETKEEEKPAEEEKKEEVEEVSEEPPVEELTEEEKKVNFRPKSPSDLTEAVLNKAFGDFSIPEKAEGFDEVAFEWANASGSAKYLKTWVLDRKRTSRVEDLKPGQWFNDTLKEWQTKFDEYQAKRKALKPSEKKEGSEEDDEVKAAVAKVDLEELKDVNDIGDGTPLYKLFAMEDWALLQLRFELALLAQAFVKDVNDSERVGIHESHLGFYYQKYFRKTLAPKVFGQNNAAEVVAMVADTVSWSDEQVLTTSAAEDATVDSFLKLAEEKRRERARRLDAGDETARLKFQPAALAKPSSGVTAPVAPAGGVRPGGLVPGKVAQEAAAAAGGQGKWASAGKGGKGGNRSTPYGQGAYGAGGNKPAWGGGGGGGGSWARKW